MKINKELIQRNISRLRRFFPQWRLYGFPVTFWSYLFYYSRFFGPLELFICAQKHRHILRYLSGRYFGVINLFADRNMADETVITSDSIIWVCWWDGEEAMPPLLRVCYNTVRQYAGTHPVRLVTKHNAHDFVSLPGYLYEKLDAGKISTAHFCDILRVALLFEYGGIWIDSTILVLKNFSFENMPFYSIKTTTMTNCISHIRWQGLSLGSAQLSNKTIPEINRWSTFLLAGAKNSLLFEFIRDFFYAYWKEHNDIIDYLFFDYIIALGCDNIPAIKNMIDNVPCIDVDKFALEKNMNTEFSEEQFTMYSRTPFHKLTWKKKFDVYTKDHKLTMYGHIINTL